MFLFRWQGRRLEMGLGSFLGTSIAAAREKAQAAREALGAGTNPIEARRALAAVPTFGEMADEVTAIRAASFRREKSVGNWDRSLKVFAANLRPIRVDLVDTNAVLKALKPIWATTPESAQKARGCIEAVLDAAKAKGFRSGENPARWRGQLDHLLPKRRKLIRGHQRAMPFGDVPAFTALLREREAISARALVSDPDGGTVRGGRGSAAVRDRSPLQGLDHPISSNEGWAGASRSALCPRRGNC